MAKLVVTTNISLDGVTQDQTGEEGFSSGGWFYEFGGKDLEQWAKIETEEALGAEALLRARRSRENCHPWGDSTRRKAAATFDNRCVSQCE
jgi:hypothetical protein